MQVTPEQNDNLKDRISSRGEEALGEVAQALLENPVFSQILQSAFGAREAAGQVTAQAMRNVGFATQADLERLERRVRGISDRLEAVEDRLDALGKSSAKVKASTSATKAKSTKAKSAKPKSS
jgi:septal ring factor EnvC (AmiA/AmiB activator)